MVSNNSLHTYELPKGKEIEEIAKSFHETLSQSTTASSLAILSAQKLSQIILAPVKDKITGKRLVIVADGVLQQIPFAALADPSGEGLKEEEGVNNKNSPSNNNRGSLNPEPILNKPGTKNSNY